MRLSGLFAKSTKALFKAAAGVCLSTAYLQSTDNHASMKSQEFTVSKEEEASARLAERNRVEENLANLNKVELLNSSEYKEGQVYGHDIIINERKIKLVVVKHKGEFYCLGGVCAYDGKTKLSEGVVFGDKLLAPENGSAYSIVNGQVEYGPAIDNIPIFETRVDKQSGKLVVFIPDVPPKKIKPLIVGRDFNDLRRVVLIGSDPAIITCAETLRMFEFSVVLI